MTHKKIAWFENLEMERHDRGFLLDIRGTLNFDDGGVSACGASFGYIIDTNYILGILDLFNAENLKECCDMPFYIVYDGSYEDSSRIGIPVDVGIIRLEPINKKFGKTFEFAKWVSWIQTEVREANYANNNWTRFEKYCNGDDDWNKKND